MSPSLRAFYGVLVGAFLVLLLHPFSRPYITQGVWVLGDSPYLHQTASLPENLGALPEPRTFEDASLWIVTACEREFGGRKLTREQTLLLVEVAQAAAERDPDNAYWRQAEAVFQRRLGNEEVSIKAWRTASLASRWDDYQNDRLARVVDGVQKESGTLLSWHYALVASRKSSAVPRTVLAYARQVLRGDGAKEFELRLATLRNGRLVRDGCKSVEGAVLGIEITELAAYCTLTSPQELKGTAAKVSPRTLITARDDFIDLAAAQKPPSDLEVAATYRENDGRTALISPKETKRHYTALVLESMVVGSLPGALVSIGVIGAAIYLLGWMFERSRFLQRLLTPPWTQLLGVILGGAVYFATRLFFPALWASVSLGTFGIRHDNQRQAAPGGLGTAYSLTIAILSVGFSLVMAVCLVERSLPGQYLLEEAGVAKGLALSDFALLSLAGVVVSLAAVTASVWGFLSRIPAERLAGPSLAKFGATVCLGCFAAGVVVVPFAIAMDKSVGDSLSKIFQNEPTYYLTRK